MINVVLFDTEAEREDSAFLCFDTQTKLWYWGDKYGERVRDIKPSSSFRNIAGWAEGELVPVPSARRSNTEEIALLHERITDLSARLMHPTLREENVEEFSYQIKYKQMCRQYGRASATIAELRGQLALKKQQIADLVVTVGLVANVNEQTNTQFTVYEDDKEDNVRQRFYYLADSGRWEWGNADGVNCDCGGSSYKQFDDGAMLARGELRGVR